MDFTHDVTTTASPEAIFDVLMDVEAWPQWTMTMTEIVRDTPGNLVVGSRLRIRQPYSNARTWVITELVRPSTFTWESRQMGVTVIARHSHAPAGTETKVQLSVTVGGPLGRWIALLSAARIRRFLNLEATGLVARALDPTYHAPDMSPARKRPPRGRRRKAR